MTTWAIVTFRTIGLRTRRLYSNLPGIGLRWITVPSVNQAAVDAMVGLAVPVAEVVDGSGRVCSSHPMHTEEPACLIWVVAHRAQPAAACANTTPILPTNGVPGKTFSRRHV